MLLALAAAAVAAASPAPQKPDSTPTPVSVTSLFDVPGKALSATRVSYPPGGKDPSHVHPNAVFVYVLTGSVALGHRRRAGGHLPRGRDLLSERGQDPPGQRERQHDRARQPAGRPGHRPAPGRRQRRFAAAPAAPR